MDYSFFQQISTVKDRESGELEGFVGWAWDGFDPWRVIKVYIKKYILNNKIWNIAHIFPRTPNSILLSFCLFCSLLYLPQSHMGTCFSERDPAKNKISQSTNQTQRVKSFDSLVDCNPQLQQETPTKPLMPPTAITAPSSVETDSKVKSIISLEDALEKSKIDIGDDEEIQNLQSWIESHNTTSSIIQIPKSKRAPASEHNKEDLPAKSSIILSGLQDCQGMSGNMQTSRFMSKMVVTSDLGDIEFMLPRSRAGPMVVPYIAYDHYLIARQTILYNYPQVGGRSIQARDAKLLLGAIMGCWMIAPCWIDQPKYFCFVTINSQTSMIIETVMIVLSVALIADAFRKFWKMRGSHNSHVTKMYILILLWWITFVVSSGYCIINYFFAWQGEQYSDEQMSHISKYSFLLNWGNAYVIQSILLLVPYHWSRQITGLFSQVERGSEVAVEDSEQFRGLDKYVYFTLKWYTRLRIIFLGLPVAFICLQDVGTILFIFKVAMSALLLDCLFITLSLILGMISLKTTKQLKQQIDEEQSGRMVNQYLMIITANTIRFGFDLYYVISTIITTDAFVYAHCPDKTVNIDMGYQLTTNILTCIFSHFLPIFIILRIYNLEERPEEMCKSLLITTSDT